jgi:hypothetical protein
MALPLSPPPTLLCDTPPLLPPLLKTAIYPMIFEYFPQHKALVCKSCRTAIGPKGLNQHTLRYHHGQFPIDQRRLLNSYCESLEIVDSLEPLPNNSPPLPFLTILDGFQCGFSGCAGFRTTSRDWIRAHINKTHQLFRKKCDLVIQVAFL